MEEHHFKEITEGGLQKEGGREGGREGNQHFGYRWALFHKRKDGPQNEGGSLSIYTCLSGGSLTGLREKGGSARGCT